ncbi:MAG: ISL3 family transposase [Phycisphaeraceae bacterium]|nr:ISL3 family transposase [Phycisphaeraceae bacterium]
MTFKNEDGEVVEQRGETPPPSCSLEITLRRRWSPRCAKCGAIGGRRHEQLAPRRWRDLPWAGREVTLVYAPIRVDCKRCRGHSVEQLSWAEPHQRQTKRFQQHVALDAFSMPVLHVATKYGLDWSTVRRAECAAIERWERTRPQPTLTKVGIDEKWLGRRHRGKHKFVTIISDLESGEPVWWGYGRSEVTVATWLASLLREQKEAIRVVAADMHRPFFNAIRGDDVLAKVPFVHDPFHVIKRAGEAVSELRRSIFFRAGPTLRAVGCGTRWLVLRPWERVKEDDRKRLTQVFRLNGKLARAYQVLEELRLVLRAPDRASITAGLMHILRRTERRANIPMRKLHDSLGRHWHEIIALAEHRPPTGRIEALNNNWETLVRRGRGYRDHQHLFRKLRFMVANPVRTDDGVKRFLALGLPTPHRRAS